MAKHRFTDDAALSPFSEDRFAVFAKKNRWEEYAS
jgi:hypothetical protein